MSDEKKTKVCVCGHTQGEHAGFIDNQINSPSPEVQWRHCLHNSKPRSTNTIYGCDCKVFREAKGDTKP